MPMKKALLTAFLLVFSTVGHATAATLSFNFSFVNAANGGGTVTGIVGGLTDNSTSAATTVQVLTNTSAFGIGPGYEVGTTAGNNVWDVSNGTITSFNFLSFGANAGTSASLWLTSTFFPPSIYAGLSNSNDIATASPTTGLTFTRIPEVPIPAALPLLASGLGALGVIGWRRKRKLAQA